MVIELILFETFDIAYKMRLIFAGGLLVLTILLCAVNGKPESTKKIICYCKYAAQLCV